MRKGLLIKKRRAAIGILITFVLLQGGSPSLAGFYADGFIFQDEVYYLDGSASAGEAVPATASELKATPSNARYAMGRSSLGDIWDGWSGDFTFLNGHSGDGSSKKPYQIKNKSQLMGFSQLVAMGMRVQPGEGNSEIIGSYDGKYFELTADIDLGGMEWRPIGFYQDSSQLSGDVSNKFFGHFSGKGKTVSNFKLSGTAWSNTGFFGAIEDAVIEDLNLNPNKTVYGKNNTAILVGSSVNSTVKNCSVSGSVSSAGTAAGIVAEASGIDKSDSVIENCTAHVTIDTSGGASAFAGGIAGKAANTSIVDCRVETGDNNTARIQGRDAVVGGIAGLQNNTDIYNSYVSGTIGGTGTRIVGGITGQYAAGKMKVARFEGNIGQSGTGAAGHRGTFIGHREPGDYFRYGSDVSFLFADAESKIAFNVCGSEISDDNAYTYGAHIGFNHGGDLFYSLVQGGISRDIRDTHFYEELENGILSVMEEDNLGEGAGASGFELDHIAPNDAGRPTKGYLITIPQIDTVSSGTNYYDVAALEARGNTVFNKGINKERKGAVAAGKSVTVTTSSNNTDDAKFQMEGVPTFTAGGLQKDTAYVSGGQYVFTMPDENTEVKAVYKKVAVKVTVVPESYNIGVVEERTGNRKNPTKTIKVTDNQGRLIATYINGILEQGTQIQPVNIQAVVDTNNDVADNSVKWSVDDPQLITLAVNDDEDGGGYTKKSASVKVNLNADFFSDTISRLEKEQADKDYQYPMPDTIFGSGYQSGGVAVLTAATRPAASFEGKPCTGNCKINVTYQVKDKTYVANEGSYLDKPELIFTVTRKLTGNRKSPEEVILVTPPQSLTAAFYPDFFDKKEISWLADDPALITVSGENKEAGVAARKDAKWIQDIIAADKGIKENDPFAALSGSGNKMTTIRVIADDMLGNRRTAQCPVTVRFVTADETKVYVEGVKVIPEIISFEINSVKTGKRNNPVTVWSGTEHKNISASVYPEQAFNRRLNWLVNDDSLSVDPLGNVSVNTGAKWIQTAGQNYPYTGNHIAEITAVTEDGGFQAVCKVSMNYKLTDNTETTASGGSSGGGGGNGGGSSTGVSPSGGTGPAGNDTSSQMAASAGSVTGTWVNTADGLWAFASNGRTYADEWAYIHNPYAAKEQSGTDWFRFDKTGHMITGWFSEETGAAFYLSPISDGRKGSMVTGWNWIAGTDGIEKCYYFNNQSDGTRGMLLKNAVAPDGGETNGKGEWTVNGIIQIRERD